MTVDEAKKIWGQITSEWNKLPYQQRGEGSKKKLAAQHWAAGSRATPFDEWFGEMMALMRQSSKASNGRPRRYLAMYRDLAMRHSVLPHDDVLNDLWGCSADGTLSGVRSRLRKEGFQIIRIEGGQFKVLQRPPQRPAKAPKEAGEIWPLLDGLLDPDPEPEAQTALIVELSPANAPILPLHVLVENATNHLADVIRQEFAHLNINIVERLDKLIAIWEQ
jgi:hypothetical protein